MREHGAAMRARLVAAALEYVWDFGYGASTIAEIARHAGVPRGSVFYYFPTKDDIVVAAIEAYVSQAHARRVEKTCLAPGLIMKGRLIAFNLFPKPA
jgi:TetR/AcrR family transcriptional regulator, transcriptional repressor for nem operon